MKARFLADADLHPGIVDGLYARNSAIDFRHARGIIPGGMSDRDVLRLAAEQGRVLVSHHRSTMPVHFRVFANAERSPGLSLLPQSLSIGTAIDELFRRFCAAVNLLYGFQPPAIRARQLRLSAISHCAHQ